MAGRVNAVVGRGAKLGVYWSLVASMMAVPVGIAAGSVLIPLITVLVIMFVCVLGTWLVSLGEGWRTAVLVMSWCLGVAVGLTLVGFGIWSIRNFSPYCFSGGQLKCFETVEEQRRRARANSLAWLVGGGVVILLVLAVPAVTFMRRRTVYRRRR